VPETATLPDARIEAAARADHNLTHGLDPEDETSWSKLGGQPRAAAIARATALVAAIDTADNRVRLTLPEFHAIEANAVRNLSYSLHHYWSEDQRAAAETAGVPEYIHAYTTRLDDQYLEPVNHEAVMASLVRERLAAALRSTAEWFELASLSEILVETDIDPAVPARFKRIMIRGCAEWLTTRADQIDDGGRLPYYRVNNQAVIDQDRHTALLRAIGKVVDRSKRLAQTDRIKTAFVMTDMLVEAIEGVGAKIPTEKS
jgi:hypothetical protein